MSKISSFIEWYKNRELELQIRIKEAASELCKDELEVCDQIKEISLEYQDNGAIFYFRIEYNSRDKNVIVYYSKNQNKWMLGRINNQYKLEQAIEDSTKHHRLNDSYVEILIDGENISKKEIEEFKKTIHSHFSDEWTIKLKSSYHDEHAEFDMKMRKKI